MTDLILLPQQPPSSRQPRSMSAEGSGQRRKSSGSKLLELGEACGFPLFPTNEAPSHDARGKDSESIMGGMKEHKDVQTNVLPPGWAAAPLAFPEVDAGVRGGAGCTPPAPHAEAAGASASAASPPGHQVGRLSSKRGWVTSWVELSGRSLGEVAPPSGSLHGTGDGRQRNRENQKRLGTGKQPGPLPAALTT